MDIDKIIIYLIMMTPVTTLLQGIPVFSNINRIFLGTLVVLLFLMCMKKMRQRDLKLIFLGGVVWINSIINVNVALLNINDLIYFWMWIFFFIYLANNFEGFIYYLNTETKFVKWIIITWSSLVFLSLRYSDAYYYEWGEGTYFKSFADNAFRFATTCLFIAILVGIYVNVSGMKRDLVWLIIPLIGVAASGSRIYLGLILLIMIPVFYKNVNKKIFFLSLIPMLAATIYIIINSNMMDKFQYVEQVGTINNRGWLSTFTSGRTDFWVYDMKAYLDSGVLHMLIGNSVTFSYEINSAYYSSAIQAHNDFLNILLSYGIIGLYVYLRVFFRFCKGVINKDLCMEQKYTVIFGLAYFINAFMNGVFAYLGATLSLPLILIMFSNDMRNTNGQVYSY